MKKATVGIVLFNPEVETINKNIELLKKQFDNIILFDNTNDDNSKLFENNDNVIYMSECKNAGIAYALNQIMEKADELGQQREDRRCAQVRKRYGISRPDRERSGADMGELSSGA